MSQFEQDIQKSQAEETNLKQEDKASTTMSEASVEPEEQEIKKSNPEKYTYINEKAEDWPQFSVEHRREAEEQTEDVFKLFYNRGTDSVMRTKLMSHVRRIAAEIK